MGVISVCLDRGLIAGPTRPDPFYTRRSYVKIDLNKEDKERYDKIYAAKRAKVQRRWLEDPNRTSYTDYHLSHEELDAIVPATDAEGPVPTSDKKCVICGHTKRLSQFYKNRSSPDYYDSACRHCLSLPVGTVVSSNERRCGHCGKVKKVDQFYRCRNRAGGYGSWCRTCVSVARSHPMVSQDEGVPDGSKRCSRCNQIRLKRDFHRHARMRDGLSPSCVDCDRERKRRRHPEPIPDDLSPPIERTTP